ncbi:MAG: DUF3138 family protein [Rhodoferax sp.]|nr:DUF3138 family protein [Rhodoferax sp.]
MNKLLLGVPLALALASPAGAGAAPTDAATNAATNADIAALKQQIQVLEVKLAGMAKMVAQPQPQPQAPAAVDPDAAPVTQEQFDKLKQQVTRQDLKVGKLLTDTYDSAAAGLEITGYIDPIYVVNANARMATFHFLNNEETYGYDTSQNGDVYLKIKKTFGEGTLAPNIQLVINPHRGSGSNNVNSVGAANPSIFSQAVATIPLNETWAFTTGYAPGVAGYEYQQGNLNNAISHNLLYDFSAPGSMMGAGMNYLSGNGLLSGKVFIGNEDSRTAGSSILPGETVDDWGNYFPSARRNNTPSLMARLDYQASSSLYVGGSFFVGQKTNYQGSTGSCAIKTGETYPGYGYQCANDSPYGQKSYVEVDLTSTRADSTYNLEIDYGIQEGAAWNGELARWWGVSGTVHNKWLSPSVGKFGTTVRLDYLNNEANGGGGGGTYIGYGNDGINGFGVDTSCLALSETNGIECSGTNRMALSLAFLLYPTEQLTLKSEFRRDWASTDAFRDLQGDTRNTSTNSILSLQAVYVF